MLGAVPLYILHICILSGNVLVRSLNNWDGEQFVHDHTFLLEHNREVTLYSAAVCDQENLYTQKFCFLDHLQCYKQTILG